MNKPLRPNPSRPLWTAIVLATLTLKGYAQTPALPAFEVASVHQAPPDHGYTKISASGATRFTATNVSMKILLELAFGVDDNQVAGKYSWLDSQLYDVVAKPEGEQGATYEELKPLLRTLLKQRFQLASHRETKDVPGYALVTAKNGAKLETGKGATGSIYILPDRLQGSSITMSTLAGMLARPVGRPVVDRTGISGHFDIKLSYAAEDATDSTLPSIFTALQEQLGLKLERQTVPIEMLVIDHLEKVPTEN